MFAIAATLLIIDVTVPNRSTTLGHALLHAWPEYAAYAVSFVTIGIMWLNHHQLPAPDRGGRPDVHGPERLSPMCIAFVPFPTRLVALHLRDQGERAAALTYGITMTLTAICFAAFWFYGVRNNRLVAEDADPAMIRGISRSYLPGAPIYGIATLVALWHARLAVALFAAIAAVLRRRELALCPPEAGVRGASGLIGNPGPRAQPAPPRPGAGPEGARSTTRPLTRGGDDADRRSRRGGNPAAGRWSASSSRVVGVGGRTEAPSGFEPLYTALQAAA